VSRIERVGDPRSPGKVCHRSISSGRRECEWLAASIIKETHSKWKCPVAEALFPELVMDGCRWLSAERGACASIAETSQRLLDLSQPRREELQREQKAMKTRFVPGLGNDTPMPAAARASQHAVT